MSQTSYAYVEVEIMELPTCLNSCLLNVHEEFKL